MNSQHRNVATQRVVDTVTSTAIATIPDSDAEIRLIHHPFIANPETPRTLAAYDLLLNSGGQAIIDDDFETCLACSKLGIRAFWRRLDFCPTPTRSDNMGYMEGLGESCVIHVWFARDNHISQETDLVARKMPLRAIYRENPKGWVWSVRMARRDGNSVFTRIPCKAIPEEQLPDKDQYLIG